MAASRVSYKNERCADLIGQNGPVRSALRLPSRMGLQQQPYSAGNGLPRTCVLWSQVVRLASSPRHAAQGWVRALVSAGNYQMTCQSASPLSLSLAGVQRGVGGGGGGSAGGPCPVRWPLTGYASPPSAAAASTGAGL